MINTNIMRIHKIITAAALQQLFLPFIGMRRYNSNTLLLFFNILIYKTNVFHA